MVATRFVVAVHILMLLAVSAGLIWVRRGPGGTELLRACQDTLSCTALATVVGRLDRAS